MSYENIRWFAQKTGFHRETVARRLEGLDSKPGAGNSKLYETSEALPRLYLVDDDMTPAQRDQIERARLNSAKADSEEMRVRRMRGELLPFDETVRAVSEMIAAARAKLLALPSRVAQSLPLEPAIRRQAQEAVRKEVYSALDELSEQGLADAETAGN